MDKEQMIAMLNKDLAEEHAAVIRYLVHGYLEGEDSPLGAGLLSRAREEMWHMHWLGMIIGKLGGEPNLKPAAYPYDPSSRKTIFKSYVDYELSLIPHYLREADSVDDPHIKRVLQREAWESEIHARKFARVHDRLSQEEAAGIPAADNKLSQAFLHSLQQLVEVKYNQMLRAVRDAWVFQDQGLSGWRIMDFSFTKMKQLAHLAEKVAENGVEAKFQAGSWSASASIAIALRNALEDLEKSHNLYLKLKSDPEIQQHAGLMINLDLALKQEAYEIDEIRDWLK